MIRIGEAASGEQEALIWGSLPGEGSFCRQLSREKRGSLIKVLFVLIFSFAQGRPTERERSCRGWDDSLLWGAVLRRRQCVQHPDAGWGGQVRGQGGAGVKGKLQIVGMIIIIKWGHGSVFLKYGFILVVSSGANIKIPSMTFYRPSSHPSHFPSDTAVGLVYPNDDFSVLQYVLRLIRPNYRS